MKLSHVILILLSVITTRKSWSQRIESLDEIINFEYSGSDFREVLRNFEKSTGFYFQFESDLLPENKLFNFRYTNKKASVVLRDILQQSGLDFKQVLGNSLVLIRWKPKDELLQISGRVSNGGNRERIVNASVIIDGSDIVIYTNSQGVFQINSTKSPVIITVYSPGFFPTQDTISGLGKSYYLDISLSPEIDRMEVAEVKAKRDKKLPSVERGELGVLNVSGKQLENMTHLLGEPDILRMLSLNPGVVGGSEGVFGMYVRGGAADQNLVLLDGVPIYNPYHLFGVFGVFNGDIVKNATFHRGSFPAKQGGRMSSIIDISTKEGSPNKWETQASLGLLSSRVYTGGPLIGDKTTLFISGRRSFFDFLVKPTISLFPALSNQVVNRYNFWDVNAKLTHRFSNKSRLSLSYYSGQDFSGLVDRVSSGEDGNYLSEFTEDASYWGNQLLSLNWDVMTSPSSNLKVKAYYTNYNFRHQHLYSRVKGEGLNSTAERSDYIVSNGIYDYEGSIHFTKQWKDRVKIESGGGFIYHRFLPNQRKIITEIDSVKITNNVNDDAVSTPEYFAYSELQLQLGQIGNYNLGVRASYYDLGLSQFYLLPEPRFKAKWNLGKKTWLNFSISQNRQFFHQLNNLTMGLPSDLWVPSTTRYRPATATQRTLGIAHQINKKYQFSIEAFEKIFQDILEYNEDAIYITSNLDWENSVTSGAGNVRGLECLFEKTTGRLTGYITYTWMKNSRSFIEINNGKEFSARYDRRHSVYAMANYRINSEWALSANFIFNSGFAYTLPIGVYPSNTSSDPAQEIFIYGERNNARTIANHRLDFSFTRKANFFGYDASWIFGVYNVYNRKNPFYINLGLGNQGNRSLYQVSLLPFMPFVNYQVKF